MGMTNTANSSLGAQGAEWTSGKEEKVGNVVLGGRESWHLKRCSGLASRAARAMPHFSPATVLVGVKREFNALGKTPAEVWRNRV